jgi:hypothetical protein
MRIEALETALIETKLKYKRELDRLEMEKGEIESTVFNKHANAAHTKQRIERHLQYLDTEKLPADNKVTRYEKLTKDMQDAIEILTQQNIEAENKLAEANLEIHKSAEFNKM